MGLGPFYSLVKCADAIARSQQHQTSDYSAIPFFWCASDDHDAGEADHTDLLHRDGRIIRVRSPLTQQGAASHRQAASAHWPQLLSRLEELAGPRLGKAWLIDHSPLEGEGLGAWCCRLLCSLFSSYGLICLEAKDLRPMWQESLETSLSSWPVRELADLRERLVAQGTAPAFPPLEQAPWFADEPTQRRPLSINEAHTLAQHDPTRLSPGAALRPILQQVALPVATYCAGPGELAYHRFLEPIYEAFGTTKPLLSERHHLTLIDAWCARGLAQWQANPLDLHPSKALPQQASDDVGKQALDSMERSIHDLEQLIAQASSDTAKRLTTTCYKLQLQRDKLAKSLSRGTRQRQQLTAAGSLRNWLYPRDQPQERVMSSVQALWHYGPGLAARMVEAAQNNVSDLLLTSSERA